MESAVQANRQVVITAQLDDAENHTSKADHLQIGVYKEASWHTANWLYHHVFSIQRPDLTTQAVPNEDPSSDKEPERVLELARATLMPSASQHAPIPSQNADMTMILWNAQTEPEIVVDRLLSSWTTLSDQQILQSSADQADEEWLKLFMDEVKVVKENETDFKHWEADYSLHEKDDIQVESVRDGSVFDERPSAYNIKQPYTEDVETSDATETTPAPAAADNITESSERTNNRDKGKMRQNMGDQSPRGTPVPATQKTGYDTSTQSESHPSVAPHKVKFVSEGKKAKRRHNSKSRSRQRDYGTVPPDPSNPFTPNPPFGQGIGNWDAWSRPYSNPYPPPSYNIGPPLSSFTPSSFTPYDANAGVNFSPPQFGNRSGEYMSSKVPDPTPSPPPPPRPPSPPRPSNDGIAQEEHATSARSNKMDEVMLAAIIKLLEKGGAHAKDNTEDDRLGRIMQLLISQQEQFAQVEVERARVVAEVEIKQLLAARDKDDANIQRLETLINQQREDQQRAEIRWRAERAELDEKFAKQAQVTQEQVKREIDAARSAQKAAQKALKFAKIEADRKAKDDAARIKREENENAEKVAEERTLYYERVIEAMANKRSRRPSGPDTATRLTNAAHDDDESQSVAEFSPRGAETYPRLTTPYHRGQQGPRTPSLGNRNSIGYLDVSHHRSEHSYETESRRSRSSLMATSSSRQTIVLPPDFDHNSAKMSELQSSLARIGADLRFQDPSIDALGGSFYDEREGDDSVQSSVLWEAPTMGNGSELLMTLRRRGWRPSYTRSSGKIPICSVFCYAYDFQALARRTSSVASPYTRIFSSRITNLISCPAKRRQILARSLLTRR